MNFLSIEYFLIILESGSISAAARRLLVSQQSLSEHIKKLEREIGTPLFKRARGITLTKAGERFAAGAKEIIDIRNTTLRDIAIMTDQKQQRITIGIATFEAPVFLPELLAEFSQRYPNYETTVIKRRPRDITHNMRGLDLYFSFMPLNDRLEHIPIIENDCYCVCARRSLFERTYGDAWPEVENQLIETGDLALLRQLPFLILQDRQGMIAQDQEELFANAGFTPLIGFQSDSGDLNSSMCIRGRGANLLPLDLCERKYTAFLDAEDDPLLRFPLSSPHMPVSLAISYQKGKVLTKAEKQFIQVTREVLTKK